MNDLMVDLETMGTNVSSPIIAIGAVFFDVTNKTLGGHFYRTVDFKSSVEAGAIIDPDTVLWWLQQSESARSAFSREGGRLSEVLASFTTFVDYYSTRKDVKVWGNRAAFDNVILSNSYKLCEMEQPWKFWNDRCYRTVKNLYPLVPYVKHGTSHNALDDAKSQALHLMEMIG